MRKLERARRFDNFFNLLLLFCFCFFPPPKKKTSPCPSVGGRGTERVFGFCGRAEEEEQSETRVEGVDFSLSLLDPKKKR